MATVMAAAVDDAAAIPHLNEPARAAYGVFLKSAGHRAFVIAPGGGWAWRGEMPSAEDALQAALADCRQHNEQRCVPYAVDHAVVFAARSWPSLWGPYANRAETAKATVGVRRGQRFPDLTIKDPAGRKRTLSDYRGKVVVVHFWGSWCPHCIKELPDLQRLHAGFRRSRDIQFMLLSVRESFSLSKAWAQEHDITLPLFDGGESAQKEGTFRLAGGGSMRDRELARVFPTTYVLDKHGMVVFSHTGPIAKWSEYAPFLRDVAAKSGR